MPTLATEQNIEQALHERNFRRARSLISRYLKVSRRSDTSRLYSAIYYRWMGDLGRALKLVQGELKKEPGSALSSSRRRLRLEAIRIINYLGGEGFALNYLARSGVSEPIGRDCEEARAFIYLWNGNFQQALSYFGQFLVLPDSHVDNDNATRIVYAAYCLFHLGRQSLARSQVERLRGMVSTPLMRAMILGISATGYRLEGEYLRAIGECREALVLLQDQDDPTPFRVENLICLGASLIGLQNYEEAKIALDQAFRIAFRPGASDEWLEVMYWQGLLKYQTTHEFPEEWQRLLVYPNTRDDEFRSRIAQHGPLPDTVYLPFDLEPKTPRRVHYHLADQTISTQSRGSSKRHVMGFRLVDRALCALLQAGEMGLSQYRLFDVLWPNDAGIAQARLRIAQLVTRLRFEGHDISWDNGFLRLAPSSDISCEWRTGSQPRGWQFLKSRRSFARKDLQGFFQISKSAAVNQISDWLSRDLIAEAGNGKNRYYTVR